MKLWFLAALIAGLVLPASAQVDLVYDPFVNNGPEQVMADDSTEETVTIGKPVVTTDTKTSVLYTGVNKKTTVIEQKLGYRLTSMQIGSEKIIVVNDEMIAQANRNTDRLLNGARFDPNLVYNGSRLITRYMPKDHSLSSRRGKNGNQPRQWQFIHMWFEHLKCYVMCVVEPDEALIFEEVPRYKIVWPTSSGVHKVLNVYAVRKAFRCSNDVQKSYFLQYESSTLIVKSIVTKIEKEKTVTLHTKTHTETPPIVVETCQPQPVQRPVFLATFGPTGQQAGGIRSAGSINISNNNMMMQKQSQGMKNVIINNPGGSGHYDQGPQGPGSPYGPPPNTTPPNPTGGAYGDGGVGQYGSVGNYGNPNDGVAKPSR